MKVWLRRKRNSLREISSNWNELAAKTENENLLDFFYWIEFAAKRETGILSDYFL